MEQHILCQLHRLKNHSTVSTENRYGAYEQHYGIPSKIVNIVRMLYRDRQAHSICQNTLKEPIFFQMADAYCLRCYFSLCIDWVIKSATKDRRGI